MADQDRQMVLVDGHAMLYRAFFAYPQSLTTRQGELINAVYGFTSILLNVLNRFEPTHLAVSFDVGETWRHLEYPEYKAHREKMPEELKEQEGRVYEILEALNVPVYIESGYEADDVIGSLSRLAGIQMGASVVIVTGDMDMLQLVKDGKEEEGQVRVYMSGRGGNEGYLYDEMMVRDKYGMTPEQIIDFKALAGDSSDNIPGIPGVGKKTALKLLSKFGSLDRLYEVIEADEMDERVIKGAMLRKVEEGKEMAYESRKLATIITDLPLQVDIDKCLVREFEKKKAVKLFEELEFRSLISKLPKDAWEASVQEALF